MIDPWDPKRILFSVLSIHDTSVSRIQVYKNRGQPESLKLLTLTKFRSRTEISNTREVKFNIVHKPL